MQLAVLPEDHQQYLRALFANAVRVVTPSCIAESFTAVLSEESRTWI